MEDEYAPFSKKELQEMVKNKDFPLILSAILGNYLYCGCAPIDANVYHLVFKIMKTVAHSIQLSYSKGEEYEKMSS